MYSCLHFPATPFPHLPPSIRPPLALSMGPKKMFLDNPFPSFPLIPLPLPSVYCQLFFTSMSLSTYVLNGKSNMQTNECITFTAALYNVEKTLAILACCF